MKSSIVIFSLLYFFVSTDIFSNNTIEECEISNNSIRILPIEIVEMILSHATLEDVYNYCTTSTANFEIFKDDRFWAFLSKRDFPKDAALEEEPQKGWKEFYKYCFNKTRVRNIELHEKVTDIDLKTSYHHMPILLLPTLSFYAGGYTTCTLGGNNTCETISGTSIAYITTCAMSGNNTCETISGTSKPHSKKSRKRRRS